MIDKSYMPFKIAIPRVTQEILPRRGIWQIIENTSLDEVLCLVAPFGSGKTTAVLSWLKEYNKKAAWVTLEKSEDSPVSFWAHFTAAILLFAGEHEKAENIFTDSHFNKNPREYARETLKRVSPPINERIMVFDGFSNIQNGGLLREIKGVISNMLGCWRIIVIGRTELPVIFNDFLLKKHLHLITLKELNFSVDEIKEYFEINGISVGNGELRHIDENTAGWPAALNAILTAPPIGAAEYNDIARAYVTGYFDNEIRESLDESYKEFLLKTSILDKLTPSICHHVADTGDAAHILRNLYVNGLFISKLEERDAYCYHRVFREFLLDKLNASDINVNELYIKAGWWLYERDESVPALLCFYRAKYYNGINLAFKKVKPAYMGMDEYVKTAYCLTSLDILDLKDCPEVAVRIALLHFLTDNITETQRIYKIAREWLEPGVLSIPPEEYVDFYWEVGWLRYVDPDEDILFNPEFDKWVNIKEYAPHLLENDRARASTLRLPSILRGVRDFSVDVEKALDFYAMNNSTQNSIRDDAGLLVIDIIYAELCYEREDFEQAEKTIERIMPIIERENYTELYFSCIELLVKMTRAAYGLNEIDELTERLKTHIDSSGHFFLLPNFHAFELRNRLAAGIPGVTEVFEKENKAYMDKPCYYLIYRHITYIRALLSENKYRQANLMLGNLDFLCRQYKRNMDLIEIDILRAVTEYGLEHENNAREHIMVALDAGRKSGFIRIFSDETASIWPILRLLRKKDIDGYIENIVISCKKMLPRVAANRSIFLTKAETAVYKLLQSAMTYNEIAKVRNVTLSTITAQINSIYKKLEVKNRASAVALAGSIRHMENGAENGT